MKSIYLLAFLLLSLSISAQKALLYNAYIGGQYIQLALFLEKDGSLNGYYIDHQTIEKISLTGHYHSLGERWELKTEATQALFKQVHVRFNPETKNLVGYYYNKENYIGHVELTAQAPNDNYEENRDIVNFNDLYRKAISDFGLTTFGSSKPFKLDNYLGRYHLEPENGTCDNRGVPLSQRRMLEYGNVRTVFQNAAWGTNSDFYECILHYQVLTYFPSQILLVVAEEKIGKINKQGDSSLTHIFRFAVYEKTETVKNGPEFWKNNSKKVFPANALETLSSRLSEGRYEFTDNYLQMQFPRKGKLACNTPRSLLLLPKLTAENEYMNFVLTWIGNKEFRIE